MAPIVIQLIVMTVFFVAAMLLEAQRLMIVWLAVALLLGIWLQKRGMPTQSIHQKVTSVQVTKYGRSFSLFAGVVSVFLAAAGDFSAAKAGMPLSAVGMDVWFPFGATMLGAVGAVGYTFGLKFFRVEHSTLDLFICVLLGACVWFVGRVLFGLSGEVMEGAQRIAVCTLLDFEGCSERSFSLVLLAGHMLGGAIEFWRAIGK